VLLLLGRLRGLDAIAACLFIADKSCTSNLKPPDLDELQAQYLLQEHHKAFSMSILVFAQNRLHTIDRHPSSLQH
jgi:hypothetical protein